MADYTVQAGDTLSKIAKANGITVKELQELNGIKDANKINIGQVLIFAPKEEVPAETENAMTLEELNERIEKLEKESLSEKAKKEIKAEIDTIKNGLIAKGIEIKDDINAKLTEWENELTEAYQKGVDAYRDAKEAVKEKYQEYKYCLVQAAEDKARSVATKAKEVARNTKEAITFDVEEETPVDLSTMTEQEQIEYQQKRLEALENRTLGDMAKEEVQETVNKAKESYNNGVDKVYNFTKKVYTKVAEQVKSFFEWLK